MYYLLISIICSVSVASLFKIIKKKNIDVFTVIQFNYLLAIVFCYFIFDSNYYSLKSYSNHYSIYTLLGILLPVLFLSLNKSIQEVGIIKTDIAQRFSLIIPILISVFFWNQSLSNSILSGLIIGFIAIGMILYKKNDLTVKSYLSPILVLLGYGFVDVLFKKVALIQNIPYTSSLLIIFTIAFVLSGFISIFRKNKNRLNKETLIWGILLGSLNFTNIYTYIKAHQILKDNPAVVFSTMNFGVIILSTFVGYLFFKENINKLNTIGIIFALLSIFLITLF